MVTVEPNGVEKTPFEIILKILVMFFERDVENSSTGQPVWYERNLCRSMEKITLEALGLVPLANIETINPIAIILNVQILKRFS